MTPRRAVALLVAAPLALIATSLVFAAAAPTAQAAAQSQASLVLDPGMGPAGAAFDATYTYPAGRTCRFAEVRLTWDGQPFSATRTGRGCTATWRNLSPPDGAAPGPHGLEAYLVNIDNSQADATYTITVEPIAPPPTDPPTAPPAAAPTANTPRPTPTPTPLALAPAGTFPAYGCRNGIPDATPCPTPTGAVAALVAGPDAAAPASTPPPSGGSTGPSARLIGLAGGVLTALAAGALLFGWRQGAGRRRPRPVRVAPPDARESDAVSSRDEGGPGVIRASFAGLLRRRHGRRVPSARSGTATHAARTTPRPRKRGAPPPPSAPRPPAPD